MAIIGEMKKLTVGNKTYTLPSTTTLTFIPPNTVDWDSVDTTWTPTENGIATCYMSPSNSNAAYVRIVDTTNNNLISCHIGSTNGQAQSNTFAVIAGHTYSVSMKSTNISTFSVMLYTFNFV